MIRALRLLFLTVLAALSTLLFSSLIHFTPSYIPYVAGAAAAAGLLLGVFTSSLSLVFTGVALCILPLFGPGVLALFLTANTFALFVGEQFEEHSQERGALQVRVLVFLTLVALFIPALCGTIATLYQDFDSLLVTSILREGGVSALSQYLGQSYIPWHRALVSLAEIFLMGMLFYAHNLSTSSLRKFQLLSAGLALGRFVAVTVLILQIQGEYTLLNLTRTPFWRYVGRLPASFSDPNAFGLMAFLLIPIMLVARTVSQGVWRSLFLVAAIAIAVASLWSGSRSVYLGLLLLVCIAGSRMFLASRVRTVKVAVSMLGLFGLIGIALLGHPTINGVLQRQLPLPGVERVLKSINWDEAGSMLESRSIYTRISLSTWRRSPILGVGLGRFYSLQEESIAELRLNLNGWKDNANNYYLGILAELGICGLLLTLLSFSMVIAAYLAPEVSLQLQSENKDTEVDHTPPAVNRHTADELRMFSLAAAVGAAMLVLLLTGPHLEFTEVRALFVLLIGLGLGRNISLSKRYIRLSSLAIIPLCIFYPVLHSFGIGSATSPIRHQGFYPVEGTGPNRTAWSVSPAHLHVCGEFPMLLTLHFRALHPRIDRFPVQIAFAQVERLRDGELVPKEGSERMIEVDDTEWHSVELQLSETSPHEAVVELQVDRLWNPSQFHNITDPRWLGIMLRWPKEGCK